MIRMSGACCIDFIPWHRTSSVTIQTQDDDPKDIGAWKILLLGGVGGVRPRRVRRISRRDDRWGTSSTTDCSIEGRRGVTQRRVRQSANNPNLPAADTKPATLCSWTASHDGFSLDKTFYLQVYHAEPRVSVQLLRVRDGRGDSNLPNPMVCDASGRRRAEPLAAPDRGGQQSVRGRARRPPRPVSEMFGGQCENRQCYPSMMLAGGCSLMPTDRPLTSRQTWPV